MNIFKKIAIWLMIVFYFVAGVKHFTNPAPYLSIIPSYLAYPNALNYLAGFFEITFALLIFPLQSRKYACFGIIIMLLAFIPAHIYMIEKANVQPFVLGKFTITPFIAWLRVPFQALFIAWAYWCSKLKFNLL